jgi:hypothetical protein
VRLDLHEVPEGSVSDHCLQACRQRSLAGEQYAKVAFAAEGRGTSGNGPDRRCVAHQPSEGRRADS